MRRLTIFLAILFLICIASNVCAATYYVAKDGNDKNLGTEEDKPWKTIQKGASVAKAGDTVYVKQGVYYEWVDVKNTGILGSRISFRAYPGDKPVIDGTGVYMPKYRGLFRANKKNYITIEGFEIRNSNDYLILLDGCDNFEIKNCKAHDNLDSSRRSGVVVTHSDNGLIDNNEVYNSAWNGINVMSSNNVTISNNYSHDNHAHNGINIFPETDESQAHNKGNNINNNHIANNHGAIYLRYQTNNLISNNLIYNNKKYGIYFEKDQKEPHNFRANTRVFNNTIANNGGNAILNGNATHLAIKNNIISNTEKFAIYMRSGLRTGHDIDNNLYFQSQSFGWSGKVYSNLSSWKTVSKQDANSIVANPNFRNISLNDYTLTKNSVGAIDKGANLTSDGILEDISGISRPQGIGFDIGAYEFIIKLTSINPPTKLRIAQ